MPLTNYDSGDGRWVEEWVEQPSGISTGLKRITWVPNTTPATTTESTGGTTSTALPETATPTVGSSGLVPTSLLNQTAASLSGALRGELPQDVQDLLRQQAAEYGVAAGIPGSQFAGYRGLRNLGLTSLDRIGQAEKLLTPMFTTPAQQESLDISRGRLQLEEMARTQNQLMQQQQANAFARMQQAADWQSSKPFYPPLATYGGGAGATQPSYSRIAGGQPTPAQTGADIYQKYAGGYSTPSWTSPADTGDLFSRQYGTPSTDMIYVGPGSEEAEYYGFTSDEWPYFGGTYEGAVPSQAGYLGFNPEEYEYFGGIY